MQLLFINCDYSYSYKSRCILVFIFFSSIMMWRLSYSNSMRRRRSTDFARAVGQKLSPSIIIERIRSEGYPNISSTDDELIVETEFIV